MDARRTTFTRKRDQTSEHLDLGSQAAKTVIKDIFVICSMVFCFHLLSRQRLNEIHKCMCIAIIICKTFYFLICNNDNMNYLHTCTIRE